MKDDIKEKLKELLDNQDVVNKIDEVIQSRIHHTPIGRFNLMPQSIDERHINWEEFGVSLASSFKQRVTENVYLTSNSSASLSIADGDEDYALYVITDGTGLALNTNRIMLANFYTTAYETSIDFSNVIPYAVPAGDYIRYTGNDFWYDSYLKAIGYANTASIIDSVTNLSGGNKTIYWQINARVLGQVATLGLFV